VTGPASWRALRAAERRAPRPGRSVGRHLRFRRLRLERIRLWRPIGLRRHRSQRIRVFGRSVTHPAALPAHHEHQPACGRDGGARRRWAGPAREHGRTFPPSRPTGIAGPAMPVSSGGRNRRGRRPAAPRERPQWHRRAVTLQKSWSAGWSMQARRSYEPALPWPRPAKITHPGDRAPANMACPSLAPDRDAHRRGWAARSTARRSRDGRAGTRSPCRPDRSSNVATPPLIGAMSSRVERIGRTLAHPPQDRRGSVHDDST
jgi:hypothetical protein